MCPFVCSEFYGGVYNNGIESQPAPKNVCLNRYVGRIDDAVNNLTGDIAAERH